MGGDGHTHHWQSLGDVVLVTNKPKRFPLALIFVVVGMYAFSFGAYRLFTDHNWSPGTNPYDVFVIVVTILGYFFLGAGIGTLIGFMRRRTLGAIIGAFVFGLLACGAAALIAPAFSHVQAH